MGVSSLHPGDDIHQRGHDGTANQNCVVSAAAEAENSMHGQMQTRQVLLVAYPALWGSKGMMDRNLSCD